MSSLIESLTGQLGPGMLGQISQALGTDRQTAGNASAAAITTLIGALSRNAAQPQGARALHDALAKDHDGSLLDNLAGFLGSGQTATGDSILGHVLGNRRPAVEAGLSRTTGLDMASTAKLLAMLAPVVLGALGKSQRQQGFDASALAGFLGQQRQHLERMQPQAMGILGSLLDTDGDGDFDIADAAKHGIGMLGKLFGPKQ